MNYNEILRKMQKLNITGNVVPINWFKTIRREAPKGKTGRPYLLAINILSEIVYWYRPREIRDEGTGALIRYEKRFKSDLLQRSYAQLAEMFGYSKREVTEAVIRLEKIGVIKRHFRNIKTEMSVANNVLFLELIPDVLEKLTLQIPNEDPPSPDPDKNTPFEGGTSETQSHVDLWDRCPTIMGEVSHYNGRPLPLLWETNTENTTEITTKNKKERKKERKNFSQQVESNKKENLDFEKNQVSDSAINGKKISDSKKSKTFDQLIEEYTQNEDLRQELKEHLKTRKLKKAALTTRGVKLSLQKLDNLASNDQEKILIVQNAIMNGWTGFFPLKKDEHNRLLSSLSHHIPSYDIEAYEQSSRAIFDLADDCANTKKKYKFKKSWDWDDVQD